MSLRNITPRQRRISEYYTLLNALSRRQFPWVCEVPADIEKLLALHSAALIEARFDAPIVARDGARHIPRAVVNSITPEGRLVMHKASQASMREIGLPDSGIGMASAG